MCAFYILQPRLGPKPFCSTGSSGDFSFDKVFNVPQAPGSENGEPLRDSNDNTQENSLASNGSAEEMHENGNCKEPDQTAELIDEVPLRTKVSNEEEKPRIISTAERRKVNLSFLNKLSELSMLTKLSLS